MNAAFRAFLRRLVRRGRLEVATADGIAETFGDGVGPPLGVKLLDGAAERRLMLNPELALGELYMDGRLVLTKGDLYDLLELGARNLAGLADAPWAKALARARLAFRGLHQRNNRRRAKRNVASHYDLDQRLYNLFLDSDRQYSCAYFEYPGQSLDDAQTAKKRHLAAKLLPKDGGTALDIGCGFGGLGLYLAGRRRRARNRGYPIRGAVRCRDRAGAPDGTRRPGRISAAGLSRRPRKVRPHRLGGHVRARRRQPL